MFAPVLSTAASRRGGSSGEYPAVSRRDGTSAEYPVVSPRDGTSAEYPAVCRRDGTSAEYPAVAESVREARETVVDAARSYGAGTRITADIQLAVSEATTNVVRHAYGDGAIGTFRVVTLLRRREMVVTIEDDGCGLREPSQRPGLGMGLGLMTDVADHASFFERERGGSCVQLRFDLG